eukprot:s2085_g22.t1
MAEMAATDCISVHKSGRCSRTNRAHLSWKPSVVNGRVTSFPTGAEREYPEGFCQAYAQGLGSLVGQDHTFLEIFSGVNAPLSCAVADVWEAQRPQRVQATSKEGVVFELSELATPPGVPAKPGPALTAKSSIPSSNVSPLAARQAEVNPYRIAAVEAGKQPSYGKRTQLIPDGLQSPHAHLAQAKMLEHPFDSVSALKPDHAAAIEALSDQREVIARRFEALDRLKAWRKELSRKQHYANRRASWTAVKLGLKPQTELMRRVQTFLNIEDTGVPDACLQGLRITGLAEKSPFFEDFPVPPSMSQEVFHSGKFLRSQEMMERVRYMAKKGTPELAKAIWEKTTKEVSKGSMSSPMTLQEVIDKYGHDFQITPSFGLEQGTDEQGQPKYRRIDDHTASGVNPSAHRLQKVQLTPSIAGSIIGKFGFLCSTLFGKVGRCCTGPLRYRQYSTRYQKNLTPEIRLSLALMKQFLHHCPDREVKLHHRKPLLIYTDASDVPGRTPQRLLGAVLFDPLDSFLSYSSWPVSEALVSRWLPKASFMGQLELLAAPFPLLTWRDRVTSRSILMFIDSDSSAASLVKGYSPKQDSAEIDTLQKRLAQNFDPKRFKILPLHSQVTPQQQQEIFEPAPSGVRKIVLTTNIAEASITVEGTEFVIDSARAKEVSYDPYLKVGTLTTSWISKASAKQRAGRAGRTQGGLCFHLFCRERYNKVDDYLPPELLRSPLEAASTHIHTPLHHFPTVDVLFVAFCLSAMSLVRSERGCIPCFNCCVAVPQDKYVTVEYFGRSYKTLRPGLNWAGCCGPPGQGLCNLIDLLTFAAFSARVPRCLASSFGSSKESCEPCQKVTKNMVDDSGTDEEIPLPNVKTAILSKVIDYCKYHKDSPPEEIQKPLKSTNLVECGVSEWDNEYVNIEQEVLFELILAANYLDIKSLLDLTCAKEIRKQFNIVNDFTPEEEAQVREENLDVAGLCVALRSISGRTQQLEVKVTTKSKDNVFCTVHISVQFAVNGQQCEDAIYKLASVSDQIEAYVSNIVRSKVPKMDIDEAFEAKDELSSNISAELSEALSEFGFVVSNVLCTEIRLHKSVMDAMNEINRQKRLRDAAIMEAEAHKIRIVKAAEAEADAAELQGDGLARQRGAIIDGLRTAVLERTDHKATTEELSHLLVISQYFETMKQIGTKENSKTFVMPRANPADPENQLRTGWLQAKAGLEGIRGRGPTQQSMGQRMDPRSASPPATGARSSPRRPQRSDARRPSAEVRRPSIDGRRPSAGSVPPQRRREKPRTPSPSPQPAFVPPAAPVRQPVTLQVQVPPNAPPGSTVQVQAPDGRTLQIRIPPGVQPGQVLQVQA